MWFNFSFKNEIEMQDDRDEPLQLTSVEIISNLHGWVIFMFFSFKAFHCSFNIGIEIGDGQNRPMQPISPEFFLTFLDN